MEGYGGVAWDEHMREQAVRQTALREHQRALTTARQAAEQERWRAWARSRNPVDRAEADAVYQVQLARIEAGHRAWLRAHGISDPEAPVKRQLPPDTRL